ncbi:MAG: hypothetical protein WKG07_18535 [Hymenobacter sp.]
MALGVGGFEQAAQGVDFLRYWPGRGGRWQPALRPNALAQRRPVAPSVLGKAWLSRLRVSVRSGRALLIADVQLHVRGQG